MLTQPDAIQRLFARINYERQSPLSPGDFKLSNMIRLMDRIDNPHLHYPIVHVAGTKGKGSVCAMIGSILSQVSWPDGRRLKVGVYSSPHLERVNQRIMISGEEISDAELSAALTGIQPVIDEFDALAQQAETKQLTFFEVITAAAFQAFADATADVVVLEVGMGGRLDSTNVCQSDICVVTNISLDHTRQLGSTVAEIAGEKAGIIKPGVPVINGATEAASRTVIERVATKQNSPIFHLGEDFSSVSRPQSSKFEYCYNASGQKQILADLQIGMLGDHQHQNAALAIAACQQLALKFQSVASNGQAKPQSFSMPPILESQIREGLALASLPGRCEVVKTAPLVILDMAHNVASATALAQTISTSLPGFLEMKERVLIFAASREKDIAGIVAPLVGLFDSIIVTQYQDNPRGRTSGEVHEIVASVCRDRQSSARISLAETPEMAWRSLFDDTRNSNVQAICISGSAFLVAELRPLVMRWAKDRC